MYIEGYELYAKLSQRQLGHSNGELSISYNLAVRFFRKYKSTFVFSFLFLQLLNFQALNCLFLCDLSINRVMNKYRHRHQHQHPAALKTKAHGTGRRRKLLGSILDHLKQTKRELIIV
jgi:hypothetical protein